MFGKFFIENILPRGASFFSDTSAARNRNRERLKQHARNEAKYRNDFNRDVVKWKSDINTREIEVDNKWQQALTKIASDDLKLWSGIKQSGIATQQAYAAMMSVGASEQSGRRSATTTNRRQAVLKYAGQMNEISSKLSLAKDTAALNRTSWAEEFTRFSQQSHIKDIEGRPMPGTPPPSITLENEPDFLTGLVLPLAGDYLKHKQQMADLQPEYTDEEMRGDWVPEDPIDIPDATPGGDPFAPGSELPEWNTGEGLSISRDVGTFFSKQRRKKAGEQLGIKFQTQGAN